MGYKQRHDMSFKIASSQRHPMYMRLSPNRCQILRRTFLTRASHGNRRERTARGTKKEGLAVAGLNGRPGTGRLVSSRRSQTAPLLSLSKPLQKLLSHMLPLLRASPFPKLLLRPPNCRTFSYHPSSSKKKTMGGITTPERNLRSRRSPLSGGPRSNRVTPQQHRTSPSRMIGRVRNPESDPEDHRFDICWSETVGPVTLKNSLLELNREKRKEIECSQNPPQRAYLRSGMILLKNYVSHHDQVKIVGKCRDLGIGSGGFYRPGYRDGAKLRLYMMCLGKNWDLDSRLYEDNRPIDGAKAPEIPEYFRKLVGRAIQDSHDFLRQNYEDVNIEDEVPNMSPDICVVNFYNNAGKLGLHQDRDESKKSLHKGLPVVSFSLGDSAEFLYGVERDADNAEKVVLESGDVLMFGGNSRLIYHGVSCIHPNTAPKRLIEETKLRPGRLNLTFRQY
ncbi:uncharacterized protein LOC103702095 [Phoenix dactylifera]|uniref:DNA N(6)-methyladenine demethylase n=1 Tax=Phoenix dactylifera TaxID=42345 RepID=A0A8B7BP82_PHODC|nr:uncharacterized protein LOC103702095 [Phoenix dactylifera]